MKTFLSLFICLAGSALFAANPAFTDFDTNQFGTANRKVVIKSGASITNANLVGDATIPAGGSLTIGTTNIIAELAGKGGGVSPTNTALYGYPTGDASMLTNKSQPGLRSFQAGVGNANYGPTNTIIAWIGDSWGASCWSLALRLKMIEQYGNGGDGYWPVNTNGVTLINGTYPVYSSSLAPADVGTGMGLLGTWTFNVDGSGPNMLSATTSDLASTLTYTSRVCRFVIIYKEKTGGGTFTYSQDGGAPVSVPTAGASGLYLTAATPTVTYGLHTLQIAITSAGSTGVEIAGVDMQNDTGVRIHHLSVGGFKSTNWVYSTSNVWQSAMQALNPGTVFVSMGGVNDKTFGVSTATYRSSIDTLEKRLKAALPYADIVFVSQAETYYTNTVNTIADFLAIQREIAVTNLHAFVDNYDLFGAFNVSTNMGLWGDLIHPSILGKEVLFRKLLSHLNDPGISFGTLSIFTRYHHNSDFSRLSVGGDPTNSFWVKAYSPYNAPINIVHEYPSSVTNVSFLQDGTTTIRSLNSPLGVGTTSPSGALDVRGALYNQVPGVGLTPAPGLVLTNTTLATSGIQLQGSPAIYMSGGSWLTGSLSNAPVTWRIWGHQLTGVTTPASQLEIAYSLNGAAYINAVLVDSSAGLTVGNGTITAGSTILAGANTSVGVNSKFKIFGSADGAAELKNTAGNAIATLQMNLPSLTVITNYTLSVANSGLLLDNIGAAATNRLTLPTAAAKLRYMFYRDAAFDIRVQAQGTDVIRDVGTVSPAAGGITLSADGSYLELFSPKAGVWSVRSKNGTFTGPN